MNHDWAINSPQSLGEAAGPDNQNIGRKPTTTWRDVFLVWRAAPNTGTSANDRETKRRTQGSAANPAQLYPDTCSGKTLRSMPRMRPGESEPAARAECTRAAAKRPKRPRLCGISRQPGKCPDGEITAHMRGHRGFRRRPG